MACEVCGKIYVWNADDNNFDSDAKPHVCTTCGQSFSLKIQLKRHTLLHANGESYVCIDCSKITEKKEPKSYNLRLSKKSDYPCDICGESFSSKRMLLRHTTKEHTYENANSSFGSDSDDYDRPKKRKTKKYAKRTRTNRKSDLYQCRTSRAHVVIDQDSDKSNRFMCTSCDKSFAYKSFLDRHIKAGKCKNTTSSLKLSIKIKKSAITKGSGDKKHVCNVCGKSFTRKSSLEGHELKHVEEKFGSSPEDEFDDYEEDTYDYEIEPKKPKLSKIKIQKSFTCDQCNFVCFSKPTFDKHLNNHKRKSVEEEEEETRGTSTESNEPEDVPEKASKRNETEKETHRCEICEKVFHTKGRMKRHLLFHVTGDGEDAENPPKWGWVKRTRSKDYSCEFCGKQFAGLTCLRKHSLKHTNGEGEERSIIPRKKKEVQPMECQFCHEVFTGKRSAFIKHVHSHTPEVCGICDERFVDRQSLREHCRVHVGTEEGRIFMECSQKALDAKNGLLPPEPKVEYIYLVLR